MQLAEAADGPRLAATLAGIIARVTGAERVGVWLRAAGADDRFDLQGSWSLDGRTFEGGRWLDHPSGALVDRAWSSGAPQFAATVREVVGALPSGLLETPLWLIPLVAGAERVGVVFAFHPRYPADRAEQTTMLRALARQAAYLVLARRDRIGAARDDAEFLAIAAHDLKNVATAVKGYAQLLGRTLGPEPPPRTERALSVIVDQVDVLVDTLNTLVDVGRLRAGHIVLDAQLVDLHEVFEAACAALEAAEGRAPLAVELPRESIQGRWDRARLVRALTLLLGAARQAPRSDQPIPVVVTVDGSSVELRVGASTPQAGWPGPTEWSGQANANLHLARRLLQAQGGTLGIRTRPEGGLLFGVRLPLAGPANLD